MPRHHLLATLLAGLAVITLAPAAAAATPAGSTTLVEIRAAHHPGVDRIVFEFRGGLPELAAVGWATTPPTLDPSGLPSHVQGNAFVTIVFHGAAGYESEPPHGTTYGPARRAFDLPNVSQVVTVGDYEAVMEMAVGVMVRTTLHATALTSPPRWVIDVGTDFPKRTLPVWYRDITPGAGPDLIAVSRQVPAATAGVAHSLLHRLFAGPTLAERAAGLRFVASAATGFDGPRINDAGIARVRLTGGCDGHGAAITVASEIAPSLRALARVDWVKVLDPAGHTLSPWGPTDSIPACLVP